jgi:hypothetical protein
MAFPDDQQQNSELILIQAIRASLEEFSVFLIWGWPPPAWIAPFETTAQTTALALPLNQHVGSHPPLQFHKSEPPGCNRWPPVRGRLFPAIRKSRDQYFDRV